MNRDEQRRHNDEQLADRDGASRSTLVRAARALDDNARPPDSADMDSPSRRVNVRLIVGVATVLGIFSTFQAYNYVTLFSDRSPAMMHLLALNMTYWYAWAVLVPAMLWVARRYRFERNAWARP